MPPRKPRADESPRPSDIRQAWTRTLHYLDCPLQTRDGLLALCEAAIRDAIDPACTATAEMAYRITLCAVNAARVIRGAADDYPGSGDPIVIHVTTMAPEPSPPPDEQPANAAPSQPGQAPSHTDGLYNPPANIPRCLSVPPHDPNPEVAANDQMHAQNIDV